MQDTPLRPCLPRARCGRFRECPICARIRQAKIADAAERLQSRHADMTWTTIIPEDRDWKTLVACRDAFLRAESPQGAIWSVEWGEKTGVPHANILHPTTKPRQLRRAAVWQAPIRASARIVAAYISKREGMPPKEVYDGRLYGTSGPLWQWLATGRGEPIIEAAKTQYDLDPAPLLANSGIDADVFLRGVDHDWADYREIAARRLPDLLRKTPLHGRSRAAEQKADPSDAPQRVYYRPVLNSKRTRWLTKTLKPWERDWKPKSAR